MESRKYNFEFSAGDDHPHLEKLITKAEQRYTEIGMASLLPKAHESSKVVAVGGGKLGLEIDGKVIKDRKDRVAFLRDHAGVTVCDAKLDDSLPKPSKKIKEGIQNAELILITGHDGRLCLWKTNEIFSKSLATLLSEWTRYFFQTQ